MSFIQEHFVDILFGLISAGLLGFCKHLLNQIKQYKKLLEEKNNQIVEATIERHLEPIYKGLNDLRKYLKEKEDSECNQLNLIVTSYRFRLIQLCKEFIHKGYMLQSEYDQLTEFYKVYHGLGGNGQAQEYYEKALKLPIQDE